MMIEKASLERVEEKGREGLKGEMEERERGLQKKLGEVKWAQTEKCAKRFHGEQ